MSIILFIGGGIALDRVTDQSPLFTFIGIALALVSAGYQLYELTQVGRPDRTPGPLTRQIGRIPMRPAGRGGTSRAGPEPGQPGPAEQRDEE